MFDSVQKFIPLTAVYKMVPLPRVLYNPIIVMSILYDYFCVCYIYIVMGSGSFVFFWFVFLFYFVTN